MKRAAFVLGVVLLVAGCGSGAGGPTAKSVSDSPQAPDPETLAGGCAILVGGDDLVQQTLDFGHLPAGDRDVGTLSELQNRLFALVVAGNKSLGDAAGQLVDYLDDPDGYNRGTGTIPKVEAAVVKINTVCGRG